MRAPAARTVAGPRERELTPAEARWENEGGADETAETTDRRPVVFGMEAVPPFRLDLSAWALRRRPGNAIDRWDGTSYRRALAMADGPVGVSIRQAAAPMAATVTLTVTRGRPGAGVENDVRAHVERMLGMRVDLSGFYVMAAADSLIGPLVARLKGLKPPRFPTVFEGLINAVACQQLSLESGLSVLNRLAMAHGQAVAQEPTPLCTFPGPSDLAGLEPQALRDVGLSRRKAATILGISRLVASGELDLEGLERLSDDEAVACLTSLDGIGRWSAEYVLLRGLGRLHVFPGDDVGARNNLPRLGFEPPLDYAGVKRAVSRWQPFAGMVYFHLLVDRLETAGELGRSQVVRSR
jgi:DNA-3-methyladenine glycosylase II